MPFSGFKNWDACMNDPDMNKRYPKKETRQKVCGKLQAQYEDFTRASQFKNKEECIASRSKKIKDTHPNLSEEKVLKMAEERCKGVIWGDYISTNSRCYLLGLRKSFEDYAELPASIVITRAVNDNLHRLQEENPDLDKKQLLQLAYDIARRENPITSDFVDDAATSSPKKPQDPQNPKDPDDINDPDKFFAAEEPVSSTNVAEVGYGKAPNGENQLLVYFKNGAGYAYDVKPPKYKAMMNAEHPGEFVWEKLRGKEPGFVIDKPSKTTPGGVGGSIVPYSKIKGAKMSYTKMEAAKEAVLKGKKEPELKEKKPEEASKEWKSFWKEISKQQRKLEAAPLATEGGEGPAEGGIDPTIRILQTKIAKLQQGLEAAQNDIVKQAIRNQIEEFKRELERYQDFIWLGNIVSDMKVIDDSDTFYGPITRGGEFIYGDTTKKKDYNQLKEVMAEVNHLPTFDAHNEDRLVGFAYDWNFDDDEERVYGHVQTFKDIKEISALREDLQDRFPVSIRFFDESKSDDLYQDISRVLHLAMSVNKTEQDRCSANGGKACYVSRADFQEKPRSDGSSSRSTTRNNGTGKTINKKDYTTMTDKEKEEEKEKVDDEEEEEEKDEDKEKEEEEEEEKDEDEEDFIEVPTDEYENLKSQEVRLSQMEDFVAGLKKREEARHKKEEIDLRSELAEDPRLESDFLEDKGLKELKMIRDSLKPLKDDNDGEEELTIQKGIKDFETMKSDFKKQAQAKWSTAGGN